MSGAGADTSVAARTALRAFVRAHHPDVGGDPVAFREGLAAHRAAARPVAGDLTAAHRSGSGSAGPHPWPAADDPRLDAPVVLVGDGRLARLGRFGRRLARRADPRRGSARVL